MKPVPRAPWITLHRWLGLVAIPFLLIAALTGSALCFVRPIDAWLNADLFDQRAPTAAAAAPAVAPLMDRFAARHPEWTVIDFPLAVPADRRIPVNVASGRDAAGRPVDQLFLDRTTARIAGSRSTEAAFDRHGFAEWLIEFHSKLLLGDPGRWFMGAIAVLWLIGHAIGFYLTFPLKRPFWKGWKRAWKASFGSVLAKFMLDWHKASALWLFVPLTALALTSVGLNFFAEGYGPLVEAVTAQEPEDGKPGPPQAAPLGFAQAVSAAKAQARRSGIGWHPATVLADPKDGTLGVTMTDDGLLNYHRLGPIYYYFDRRSHVLVETLDPYHGNGRLAGYRLLYPLHSGRVGGNLTILLAFASGLATAGLCVTGLYVWWKKRRSRVAQRQAARRKAMAP